MSRQKKWNCFLLGLFAVVLLGSISAQTTFSCPEGDDYKCYTETKKDGSSVTVFKGSGAVEVKIPKR